MAFPDRFWITGLPDATLHPPALSSDVQADDATAPPWVLLESDAYVADRRNATTACTVSRCGKELQVTLCVDRPPRVSYICVFCRTGRSQEERAEEMIGTEPQIITTEGDLVLLRMEVGSRKNKHYEHDLFVYRPGGSDGPSLTMLKRPPGDRIFSSREIGLVRCRRDSSCPKDESYYMVAALRQDMSHPVPGLFLLYLYNSRQKTWTTTVVSVDEQQMRQHQHACTMHYNTKVITIGGEDDTIGFVDLWRGILLCDLRHVQHDPRLRYIPLPETLLPVETFFDDDDARLTRDIAVVEGRITCVRQAKYLLEDAWFATSWSRTISSLEDTWQMDCEIESSAMDVSIPQFELLPKPQGRDGPLTPFKGLTIMQPTLSLQDGDDATVCFMVKGDYADEKAWVIAVDMMENKLQEVVEFDAKRYVPVGFSYLHSRISKYVKTETHVLH